MKFQLLTFFALAVSGSKISECEEQVSALCGEDKICKDLCTFVANLCGSQDLAVCVASRYPKSCAYRPPTPKPTPKPTTTTTTTTDPRPNLRYTCLLNACIQNMKTAECKKYCEEVDCRPLNNPQNPPECPKALKNSWGLTQCVMSNHGNCWKTNEWTFNCDVETTTSTLPPVDPACTIERCKGNIIAAPGGGVTDQWCKNKCEWYMLQDHQNYKSDFWCPEATWNPWGYIGCVVDYFPACKRHYLPPDPCPSL